MMIQKIAAVITVAGAFVLGLHEGDCTAAVVMGLLLLPAVCKKKSPGRARAAQAIKKLDTFI